MKRDGNGHLVVTILPPQGRIRRCWDQRLKAEIASFLMQKLEIGSMGIPEIYGKIEIGVFRGCPRSSTAVLQQHRREGDHVEHAVIHGRLQDVAL